MPRFRVIDPDKNVIDEKEFNDSTQAYDWFKSIEVPDDSLGYGLQVEHGGEWDMFESNDGGTNTSTSD